MASPLTKTLSRPPKSFLKLIRLSSRSSRLLKRIVQSLNILPLLQVLLRLRLSYFLSPLPSLLTPMIVSIPSYILPSILLVLNFRSFPFIWTFRVLWCVIKVRMRYGIAWAGVWTRYWMRYLGTMGQGFISQLSNPLLSRQNPSSTDPILASPHRTLGTIRQLRIREMESWLESVTPVGVHPFEWEGKYVTWAGFDDSDFNMHMSNSSYPKVLDFARTKASLELFPQFLRVGGHVALSSTHFHFLKEIPLLSRYEIITSIGAWDEKWCYLIFRFVGIEKRRNRLSNSDLPNILITPPDSNDKFSASSKHNLHPMGNPNPNLYTIAVSRICFKHGRITVPPAIVFATNGMSMHPWEVCTATDETTARTTETEAKSSSWSSSTFSPVVAAVGKFSHRNPPPSWTEHGLPLIAKIHGGTEAKLREFYRGAWRVSNSTLDREKRTNVRLAEAVTATADTSLSDCLSQNKLTLDDRSIWASRSTFQGQFVSDPSFNSSSYTASSSSNSDTGSDYSSDSDASPASSTPATSPSTPTSTSPVLSTPEAVLKSTASSPMNWWDYAMAIGTAADKTRKTRLDICRKLVGGMEGVKDMC
ncbi:hypothetical protein C8R42DRAFT_167126 [Lentinula raphanica]|nr:hypothetical protein C8R42DRAFT_167126 [Lentinula raphanica]